MFMSWRSAFSKFSRSHVGATSFLRENWKKGKFIVFLVMKSTLLVIFRVLTPLEKRKIQNAWTLDKFLTDLYTPAYAGVVGSKTRSAHCAA